MASGRARSARDRRRLLDALSEFNITREDLEQALASVQQVAALKTVQEREKSVAQTATQKRNAAFKALNAWMVKFREVARIALVDNSQHLESLQLGSVP